MVCQERALTSVCYCANSGSMDDVVSTTDTYGPWSGQVMSTMKEACRNAFLAGERRLVEAIFTCQVQTAQDSLGKAYSVLNKRRARVVDESIRDGTDTFIIDAFLPVVESFGLVNDLRKQTSGSATCQLSLSGWELMESDPFVSPQYPPPCANSNMHALVFQCHWCTLDKS